MKTGALSGLPPARVHHESFEVFRKNDPFMADLMLQHGEIEFIDAPGASSCKA